MICVVIGRTRHKMMQAEIQEAARRGAQLIELRLDYLAKSPDFKRLLDNKPCPMIATVRKPEDGGRWSGAEESRRMLLRQAVVAGFDWVDVETDIADVIRRFRDVKRVVSYHNLKEVPPDLEAIYQRMCGQDPDVVKISVTAQQATDNLRVLRLLKNAPRPTIALCMGDLGAPTRLLGAKYGAPFTYAAFNKDYRIAPGLPSFDELKNVYYYDRIDPKTQVFGVIGDPVAHSLSPLIHNAAFRQQGVNALYLPFRVPRSTLGTFLKEYDKLGLKGYSVTIPHKESAAVIGHHQDPAVSLTGSANTLVRVGQGFAAYNTDYQAGLDSLQAAAGKLDRKIVLLLGAGGVARALAHAIRSAGALATLTNRTPERAQKLAAEVQAQTVDWASRHTVACDIIVNCTSVGMHPDVDDTPYPGKFLKPGMVVMDTVYTPENTLLVKEARAKGCTILTGVDMFVRQAAMQFQLFTSQEPPLDLMLKLVRRALSPVALSNEPEGTATAAEPEVVEEDEGTTG